MNGNEMDRLLRPKEAGHYLGLSEGTVRNKVSRGEIPHTKLGRTLRFRISDLNRWIDELNAASREPRKAGAETSGEATRRLSSQEPAPHPPRESTAGSRTPGKAQADGA